MIWGTSTDDSLGEDAKVTILATGLEDDMRKEASQNVYSNEDDYYEDLIPKLYRPAKKVIEVITQELPFVVEAAEEPEPAIEPETKEPEIEEEPENEEEEPEEPTMLDKWKKWLTDLMNGVTE